MVIKGSQEEANNLYFKLTMVQAHKSGNNTSSPEPCSLDQG